MFKTQNIYLSSIKQNRFKKKTLLDRYIEGVVIDLKTNCELCETIICLWTLFTHKTSF